MLDGIRVLDLSEEPGWLAGKILAELGADVVKLEPPGGDPGRIGPFLGDIEAPDRSLKWLALNTSKRGITLDLRQERGAGLLSELAQRADVLLETFAPGTLAERGCGFEALRERLSSGEGRRAGKHGSSAILSAILSIAILGTLGWFSAQYNKRFDWTEAGVHTLTSQTIGILEGLDSEVRVTAFFNKLDAPPIRDLHRLARFRIPHAAPVPVRGREPAHPASLPRRVRRRFRVRRQGE